jgi:fatty-acyl-CoA synthase
MANVAKAADLTLPGLIDQLASTHEDRIALSDPSVSLSYSALGSHVRGYAAWARDRGWAGRTVALHMPNCSHYAAAWLGLTRAGCTVALLNTNQRGASLQHSLSVSGAVCVITNEAEALGEGETGGLPVAVLPENPPRDSLITDLAPPQPDDVALLIFTSGTTGLPKAAKLTHRRIAEWSFWFAGMMDAKPQDRLYDCLPMYHSTGGVVAVGAMLVSGGCVVIRERFSATRFWPDVVESECTLFQYIGELCRYLASAPPHVLERRHRLRMAVGNGLQDFVWRTLQERFAIPHVLEFYAATEGVVSLYNLDGEPGAIGCVPAILEPYLGIKLIRVDPETGDPVRNDAGYCVACEVNEVGEAIGRIAEGRSFDGYGDPYATGRKILHDVFAKGDRWFRSGDLMRRNAGGSWFFVDRLGDTFRWKGENVSTTEVASVIRTCPGVADAVVYGVQVPGAEGRAGMAAIVPEDGFALERLAHHLEAHLPGYARPQFVRLCRALQTTATFKLVKTQLAEEGYASVGDPVWRYDEAEGKFVLLT